MYQISRPFFKARTTSATTTSFPSRIATITEPSGDGVHDLASLGIHVPCKMMLVPYALGDDDDAFVLRVISWSHIRTAATQAGILWVPTIIGEFTCTVGTSVGVASSPVLNTERFADTIAIVTEPTLTSDVTRQGTVELVSPTNNLIAHVVMHLGAGEKVEFTFDTTTGDPTSVNSLVRFI